MNTRFAGSRHLDERRRRRLAGESDGVAQSLVTSPSAERPESATERKTPLNSGRDTVSPVPTIIPAQLWKYILLAVAGIMICGLTLAGGYFQEDCTRLLGPGIAQLLAFTNGRMTLFLSTVLLLLAAELALVIWWRRSKSPRDFGGRYRVWMRAASVWILFAFCAATGAHWAFSSTLLSAVRVEFWQNATLCWLVPAIALGSALFWQLRGEMRGSRIGRILLYLGGGMCLISAALLLLPPMGGTKRLDDVVAQGIPLCVHLCFFLSMVFHCRYVFHVNADPSEDHLPRRAAAKEEQCDTKSPEESTEDSAEDLADARDVQVDEETTTPLDRDTSAAEEENEEDFVVEDASPERQSDEHPEPHRPNMKGLTKRQRRALQKARREEQRALQAQ